VYNHYILLGVLKIGLITSKILDLGVIELLGPYGLSQSLYGSSTRLARLDTGSISEYGLYIFVAAISLTLLLITPLFIDGSGSLLNSLGDTRLVLLYAAALFYRATPSATQASNHLSK
jgi:NADH-ubiquinone oxidoreductase chain 5